MRASSARRRSNNDGDNNRGPAPPHDPVTITSAPARGMLRSHCEDRRRIAGVARPARAAARAIRRRAAGDRRRRARALSAARRAAGAGDRRRRRPAARLAAASGSRAHGPQRAVATRRPKRCTRRGADAAVVRAAAEALPIAAGACGGVVGLCVFDAVADAQAAVAEIARVLAPGGRFVHLLDMATLLEQPFEKLAGSGLVPIPNVFGDPGDHEWPLDVVLLRRDWLANLLRFAADAGHPFAATFAPIFAPFLADSVRRRRRDQRVQGDRGQRRPAPHAGRAADVGQPRWRSRRATRPSSPCPFTPAAICRAGSRPASGTPASPSSCPRSSRRAVRRPAADDEKTIRYRSLCLGHERLEGALPRRLLAGAPEPPARRRHPGRSRRVRLRRAPSAG